MRTKVLSLICFTIFISNICYSQTDKITLTFEDALNMSYKNNSIFKQNELLKKEKKEERKAALGLYLPQINIGANYFYMEKDLHLDLSPVRDAITPLYDVLGNYGSFTGASIPGLPGKYIIDPLTGKPVFDPTTGKPIDFTGIDGIATSKIREQIKAGKESVASAEWDQMIQKKSFATLSTNLMWPLYAGGKIRAANKVASLYQENANIKEQQNTSLHINEMVERYYGLCLANQVEKVREEVYIAMKNHLNDAEKMYKGGIIAKVQFLHAKVFHDDAERELKKAKRQVEIVQKGLCNTLGIENSSTIIPVSKLFYSKDIKSIDFYKFSAKENSPILKLVDINKSLAKEKFKIERSELLPSVAAMGVYDIANKDLSNYTPKYMLGVGLKWNIFGGQRAYRKTKAAKYTIDRVEEVKTKYNSDINTGITKYYENLKMNIEQLEALESSMSFANEYYSVVSKSFKEGMATSTELVDAKLAVTKVKIEKLKVLYDFDVYLSKLLDLSGISHNFIEMQMNGETTNDEFNN